jgi:hypothetical protein
MARVALVCISSTASLWIDWGGSSGLKASPARVRPCDSSCRKWPPTEGPVTTRTNCNTRPWREATRLGEALRFLRSGDFQTEEVALDSLYALGRKIRNAKTETDLSSIEDQIDEVLRAQRARAATDDENALGAAALNVASDRLLRTLYMIAERRLLHKPWSRG